MVPVSTHKANGQRYWYYVSDRCVRGGSVAAGSASRISTHTIEQLVIQSVPLSRVGKAESPDRPSPATHKQYLRNAVDQVIIRSREVEIHLSSGAPLTVPIRLKVGAGGKAISAEDELSSRSATLDHALIHAVARTSHWRQLLETGQARTPYDLARREKCRVSYVQRHLPLAFLPPLLVESIIAGRQPHW